MKEHTWNIHTLQEIIDKQAEQKKTINQTNNNTSIPTGDGWEINVWWYVLAFFVLVGIVMYIIYKKRTKSFEAVAPN